MPPRKRKGERCVVVVVVLHTAELVAQGRRTTGRRPRRRSLPARWGKRQRRRGHGRGRSVKGDGRGGGRYGPRSSIHRSTRLHRKSRSASTAAEELNVMAAPHSVLVRRRCPTPDPVRSRSRLRSRSIRGTGEGGGGGGVVCWRAPGPTAVAAPPARLDAVSSRLSVVGIGEN